MSARIDVYHHLPTDRETDVRLTEILAKLDGLTRQGDQQMKEIDILKDKVTSSITVQESAIVLLNGLGQKITELKDDPIALQELADKLSAESDSLAAAISANTPAEEPPPAGDQPTV